jgi:hypothetical protein
MSSEAAGRPKLLIFCDSLSYYGPTGGLPSDDPRSGRMSLPPSLGWDVELIGRIGWTCRDVWWAATQDPRSWAALRYAARWCSPPVGWIHCLAATDGDARTDPVRPSGDAAPMGPLTDTAGSLDQSLIARCVAAAVI